MVSQKIKTLEELGIVSKELKSQGKRIVQCHGVFDLMHPGHVKHFWAARELGDVLVVTITGDAYVQKGPGRPVFNERLRAETIASLSPVDFVAVNYAPEAVPAIEMIRPNVYFKGGEYSEAVNDMTRGMGREAAAARSSGGDVAFSNEVTFSSSELLNQFFSPYPPATNEFLKDFKARHTYEEIRKLLESVRDLKVLVIGESIIDEYHYATPMGKSAKEAILATRFISEESFAGGVLACANHLAGICRQVDLVTAVGTEEGSEAFIRAGLKTNVQSKIFTHPHAPTIRKRRYIDPPFLTKMFEVYFFDDRPLAAPIEAELAAYLEPNLSKYDLVIAVDYGHGLLNKSLRDLLAAKSKFLAMNAQANSGNLGYHTINKYNRADYVCIDHAEARLALGVKHIGEEMTWEDAIRTLAGRLGAKKFVITLGHEGCMAYDNDQISRVPVLSQRVVDRVGAGDAFLAITSPLAAIGAPNELIGFIGNAVGAIAVTIVGNKKSVEPKYLMQSMRAMLK